MGMAKVMVTARPTSLSELQRRYGLGAAGAMCVSAVIRDEQQRIGTKVMKQTEAAKTTPPPTRADAP